MDGSSLAMAPPYFRLLDEGQLVNRVFYAFPLKEDSILSERRQDIGGNSTFRYSEALCRLWEGFKNSL